MKKSNKNKNIFNKNKHTRKTSNKNNKTKTQYTKYWDLPPQQN